MVFEGTVCMKKLSLPELDRVQLRILLSFEQESRSRVPDLGQNINGGGDERNLPVKHSTDCKQGVIYLYCCKDIKTAMIVVTERI